MHIYIYMHYYDIFRLAKGRCSPFTLWKYTLLLFAVVLTLVLNNACASNNVLSRCLVKQSVSRKWAVRRFQSFSFISQSSRLREGAVYIIIHQCRIFVKKEEKVGRSTTFNSDKLLRNTRCVQNLPECFSSDAKPFTTFRMSCSNFGPGGR